MQRIRFSASCSTLGSSYVLRDKTLPKCDDADNDDDDYDDRRDRNVQQGLLLRGGCLT